MAQVESDGGCRIGEEEDAGKLSRNEKRKLLKKIKRKGKRKDVALKEKEEEEIKLNDPEEQRRIEALEREEMERIENARREFEERERVWMERMKKKKEEEEEEARRRMEEEEKLERDQVQDENDDSDGYEYVEEGPAEIIWQGNEIIVKKKKVKVPKKKDKDTSKEEAERPTSNPLPPQSEAYMESLNAPVLSAQQAYDNLAQQVPSFGTEQDKDHCPFHIKTGVCRFGSRCNRAHFYPNKSCTLLIKNMYSGPGLAWEQDEALEYTEEEVERSFEEFYDDVHTEFLKFGEIINFKVCKNGSAHLRGNVYVHYKLLDSTLLAYHAINGRFFAGKQVKCEYVGVTRWKTAICGEYMKTRLSTCSRGTACNFIHCFRNPGGDYEWADWDKPPPRYWVKKMSALFGYTDDSIDDHRVQSPSQLRYENSQAMIAPSANSHSRRSRSRERESSRHFTDRNHYEKFDSRNDTQWQKHKYEATRHAARRIVKDSPGRDCTDTVTSSNNNRDPSETRRSSGCQTRDERIALSEDDADHRSRKELHGDDETNCDRPSNRSRREVVTKNSETRGGRTWNSEAESNENGGGAVDHVEDSCRYYSGRTRQESNVKDRNISTNWDKGRYETTDLTENRYRDKVEERRSHKHQKEHRDDCKRKDKEKVSLKHMSHNRDDHNDIECSPRKKRRRSSGPTRGSYASSPEYAYKKKTYCAESNDVHSDDYVQPHSSSPIGQENEAVGIIHDRWDPECVS